MVLLWQSSAFLLRLGFFPQHAGFGYLACAISSIAANPMNYYGHGSDIFGILESEYGISRAKATRCMRYSIAIAWQSQENKEFHALFKSYGDEFPPPVSEFIFRSAFEIRSAQIRESETDNSISSVLKPWNCNSKQDFSCCAPTWRQVRQAHKSRKPKAARWRFFLRKSKLLQHFSAKESFGRSQNKCITCLQRTVHCIHLNNLCPCFCAGILLSRSFDARDAPNKPYFQRKLTDSLSNLFNALPAIFCTAEVLSLLLLRKLQLHSITAIRKLKCTNPLKKQPAVNAAHKGFGTQNTPNATAFCSSRSPMPFRNPNPLP